MKKNKFCIDFADREKAAVVDKYANLTLGELAKGFVDNSMDECGGVYAWNNKLNIRPKFQRAYVVDTNVAWKAKLVDSVIHGLPIGLIYFGYDNTKDGNTKYLVLDGQQRFITLFEFINNEVALPVMRNGKIKECLFSSLTENEKNIILSYTPYINIVSGSEDTLLDWFKTINQQISILTPQELRNTSYCGSFVEATKRIFSKVRSTQKPTFDNWIIMDQASPYCYKIYTNVKSPERCDVMELALDWLTYDIYPEMRGTSGENMDMRICRYLSEHRESDDVKELVEHYKKVYDWVRNTFKGFQKCMRKVNWGRLYSEFGHKKYDLTELNYKVNELLSNDEVTANSNVFEFVLLGCPDDKISMLVPRCFRENDKAIQFSLQGGYDPITLEPLTKGYVAHHILPFNRGGKTNMDNIVLINKETHSNIHDGCMYSPEVVKSKRDSLMDKVANHKKIK